MWPKLGQYQEATLPLAVMDWPLAGAETQDDIPLILFSNLLRLA